MQLLNGTPRWYQCILWEPIMHEYLGNLFPIRPIRKFPNTIAFSFALRFLFLHLTSLYFFLFELNTEQPVVFHGLQKKSKWILRYCSQWFECCFLTWYFLFTSIQLYKICCCLMFVARCFYLFDKMSQWKQLTYFNFLCLMKSYNAIREWPTLNFLVDCGVIHLLIANFVLEKKFQV